MFLPRTLITWPYLGAPEAGKHGLLFWAATQSAENKCVSIMGDNSNLYHPFLLNYFSHLFTFLLPETLSSPKAGSALIIISAVANSACHTADTQHMWRWNNLAVAQTSFMLFFPLSLILADSCTFCTLTSIPVKFLPFLCGSAQDVGHKAVTAQNLRTWTTVIFIMKTGYLIFKD